MPETQRTSKHTPSTPHSIPSNPQPQHKRKREHDGDSGENIRKVEKRSKVLHNRSDDMENIQTRSAEVARAVLSEEPAKGERNGHDALEAKVARNLEISVTKLAKRERRKREREEGLNPKSTQNLNGERNKQDQTKSSSSIQDEDGQKTMEDRAIVKEKNKKEGKPANVESTWKTSEPIGGRFIDAEPLFSADENYLLLAKESNVEIYSTSTSLLVRLLAIGYHSSISGYAFSTTHHNILYVSTFSGLIYKWNWIEGKKIARWDISSQIANLGTAASTMTESDEDIVYTIDKKGKWTITAHKLMAGDQASKTQLVTLYRSPQPISGLRVVEGGRALIATSENLLMIGVINGSDRTSLISTTYVWRQVTLPEWITCFDVRVAFNAVQSIGANSEKLKSRNSSFRSSIDIVAGGAKGEIYIYKDLLEKLIQKERLDKTGRAVDLAASLQHWHREAVSTVKWSLDGNYIISGGAETVLVLWQLDTSKKQFLPHLSSAIESLVVSPRGSSYALRLADNSAMVLSTSELKPTASIAGIQCRSKTHSCVPQPRTKTVNSSMAERLDHPSSRPIQTPSAVNPLNPSQLLLAVSASQPTYSESAATNRIVFLQTFDFGTTQHVSRQALARTNTTALNIGPDGGKIGEPDVKYMRVSHDGQWLATVDEWSLPSKDIEFLSLDERPSEEEQQRRLEVFLKFWLWNAEAKEWQLVTRVDSPHALTSVDESGAGGVLTFVADPSALGFASLGEDGVVRFWRPKIRRRNGIEIRGKNAEVLISWHCQHVVQLENTSQQRKLAGASPRASMAFSEDGSLLAVSQQCSSADRHGVVHFIDTASGRIRQSRAGLYAGDLIDMGIVDRYLIILSEQLNVWDMVDDELHFGLSLQSYRFSSQERAATTHLTVDQRHHTFAIALPVIGNEKHKSWFQSAKRSQSQIAVFDPSQPTPLYTTLLPHMITSLLPAVGSKGYIILDSAAEVCILSPKSVPFMSNVALAAGSTEPLVGLENVYGRSKTHAENSKNDGNDLSEDESDAVTPPFASAEPPTEIYDDDEPVVSQQQLAGIFDVGSAFAMPPIDELFERVAGLFAKKPRSLG